MIKKISENLFFLKLLITYCLLIIIGLSTTSYYITSRMMDKLLDTQAKYENEILGKVKTDIEAKYKTINTIVTELYYEDNSGPNIEPSIIEMISPYSSVNYSDEGITKPIRLFVQNAIKSNNFITDVMVVDYARKKTYFQSNEMLRDIPFNFDFYRSVFINKLKSGSSTITTIPNYVPDYLGENAKKYPIMTLFTNLYDPNFVQDDKKIGVIAFNLKPEVFSEAYKSNRNALKGKILVMDEAGFIFFDSSGELTGKKMSTAEIDAEASGKNSKYIVNKLKSDANGYVYVSIIDKKEIYKDNWDIRQKAQIAILVCITLSVLITIFISKMFTKRIKKLVTYMKSVEQGNLDVEIQVGNKDEIGYLEASFNKMCRKLENYVTTVYLSELRTKTAELKALHAQINPHFMFNTLESIRAFAIINKDKETAKMIHILGNMFRWNLKMVDMFVDIYDELEYIDSYLELQNMRHKGTFNYQILLVEPIEKFGIPKITLQPLIENAIHHGIGKKEETGEIVIRGYKQENDIILEVIDNGRGINQATLKAIQAGINMEVNDDDLYSIGLRNVHQRVQILYGKPYGIEIESELTKGTIVKVKIPALSTKEMKDHVQGNYRG